MNWRVCLWMSSSWLALWPGLWFWLPGEPELVSCALRFALLSAPFCLVTPSWRIEIGAWFAAWLTVCAGLCGAYLLEDRRADLPVVCGLLAVWSLALRGFSRATAAQAARVRLAAWSLLFVPWLGVQLLPDGNHAWQAVSPWYWDRSRLSFVDAWPVGALCLLIACRGWRWSGMGSDEEHA